MAMKKNILIIDNSTGWTGAFKSIVTVAEHLSASYHFHFCIPSNSANKQFLEEKGIPILALNFIEISKRWRTLFYLPQLLANAIRVKSYCRKNNIQTVHVNDMYNLTGIVVKMMSSDIKLIYHVRLLESSYAGVLYKGWITLIAKRTDHMIAVSQAAKINAARYTKRSIAVIYDCISGAPAVYQKSDSNDITFLYLANYISGKGHEIAIKGFAQAFRQNSTMKLIMAGGDLGFEANRNFKKSLSDLILKEGISDEVELRNFEPDVQKIMSECHVFLNFSRSESFSMTCLEAITNGKPVIATDSGGPGEIVKHNYCGIIIPVGDVKAASEAMLLLAQDTYKRDHFGRNAIQRAGDKFNLNKEAAKLSVLYNA